MASGYFRNFPIINYTFGDTDTTSPSLFQNITTAISILDELKGNMVFANTATIRDNERPDTFSYSLYGTTDYYWTFYFLNQDLRESGWPLTEREILPRAKIDYPNIVLTTKGDISTAFLTGQSIEGLGSGAVGRIRKKNLDLGQIVVAMTSGSFDVGENVFANEEQAVVKELTGVTEQYNAVHHYEDTDGVITDINPATFNSASTSLIPITYLNRVRLRNDALRSVDVFKPEVAAQVAAEFNNLLRFE